MKCIQCKIYYKKRNNDRDTDYEKKCCYNCSFICSVLRMTAAAAGKLMNRVVWIDLNSLVIKKISKK